MWVIFALIVTAIAFGIVPLEWQAAWALQNFWDCIYLVRSHSRRVESSASLAYRWLCD